MKGFPIVLPVRFRNFFCNVTRTSGSPVDRGFRLTGRNLWLVCVTSYFIPLYHGLALAVQNIFWALGERRKEKISDNELQWTQATKSICVVLRETEDERTNSHEKCQRRGHCWFPGSSGEAFQLLGQHVPQIQQNLTYSGYKKFSCPAVLGFGL